jgi:hypothetical protein
MAGLLPRPPRSIAIGGLIRNAIEDGGIAVDDAPARPDVTQRPDPTVDLQPIPARMVTPCC